MNLHEAKQKGREEVKEILIDWEGKSNPMLGAFRVAARMDRLDTFLDSYADSIAAAVREDVRTDLALEEQKPDDYMRWFNFSREKTLGKMRG